MKKRDFLFLGLALATLPVVAQRPESTPQDAKVIFTQNFEPEDETMSAEEAWDAWQAKVWDSITVLKFYNRASSGNIGPSADNNIYDGSNDWKIGYERTDSIIPLKNGVVITDANVADWPEDLAKIVTDETPERAQAFDKFGEDGGKYIFRYISGKPTIASSQYGEYYQNVSAAYRRNLFVRGLDIEDNTSYRVTLFIKGKAQGTTKPKFYLNMMRGYFNSECDFSMGYVDNNSESHPLEYSTSFSLTKEDFNGEWEKVTFMTHYLTDSISNAYIFTKNGYWWSGRWWATDTEGKTYDYIQQPDKFFLRLSFASDSTTFDVDNIAITKSTIGGIEHEGTMIRVNFGYETNLKALADAAYKKTGVAAIELPGEYFSVSGLIKGQWYPIAINSAEYHDDGYMYMWSKDSEVGGKYYENPFSKYDSVLVSFTNPDVDDICLKYSGDRFPYALDTAWIVAGKKLRGFSNELSVPNPNIIRNQYGKRVYSMKALPPVLTDLEYEKGSFNLPGTITSMKFKFSRPVMFDKVGSSTTEEALLKVMKGGVTEFWFASSATGDADSTITFTRQAADITKGALDGDYKFELCGIQGIGTDYAENEVIDYSFGPTIMATTVSSIDFSNLEESTAYTQTLSDLGIEGLSGSRCAAKITSFADGGAYTTGIMWGLYGQNTGAENNEDKCCKLIYTFTTPADGKYAISFGMTGCQKGSWNDDANMTAWIFDGEGTQIVKESYGGTGYKPNEGGEISAVKDYVVAANLKAGEYKLVLGLPNEGSWGGGHKGGKILFSLSIQCNFTNGYPYVNSLNGAYEALTAKLAAAEAEADRYTGTAYEASLAVAEFYEGFTDTKPSRYNTVTDSLAKALSSLQARFDLIAALDKKFEEACDTLGAYETEERKALMGLVAYGELGNLADEVYALVYSDMTDDSIKSYTTMLENSIKALNNRNSLIADFYKQLAATKASIDAAEFANVSQYADMVAVYGRYENYDVVAPTDDDLKAATSAVKAGTLPYDSYVAGVKSTTVRIKALADLAEELGVVIGDEETNALYQERVLNAINDDVTLAEVYKVAIRIAILTQLVNNDFEDEIDLTGFIRNFNMYTAGSVKSDENPNGELEKYYYQWGQPNDRWHLIAKKVSENAFPGWTTTAAGGNVHLGSETVNWSEPMVSIFDAYITADWSSAVTMSQVVTDLPAGKYTLGVGLTYTDSYSRGKKIQLVQFGDSAVTWELSGPTSTGVAYGPTAFVEDLEVNADTLELHLSVPSVNSWTRIDNWSLVLTEKLYGHDYVADLQQAREELAVLLNGGSIEPEIKVHQMYFDDIIADAGEEFVVPIKMQNTDDITAFSLDIEFPSGISFVSASLSSRSNGHRLSTNSVNTWLNTNVVSLACWSIDNNKLIGNDGAVVYLTMRASDKMDGSFNVFMNNLEMTVSPTKRYKPQSYTGRMRVNPYYVPGDVNMDGEISITDAVGVVAFIINSNTSSLNRYAADANQNGSIDVSDAVWIVNRVIGRYYAPARNVASRDISSSLILDDTDASDRMSLPIRLEGMPNEITAIQFSLSLPQGVKVEKALTDEDHMIACRQQEDGKYTVVCLSPENTAFAGDNAAITLELASDMSFEGGTVTLSDGLIVTPDCRVKSIDEISSILSDAPTTNVLDIDADGAADLYDLQGRKGDNAAGILIRGGIKVLRTK